MDPKLAQGLALAKAQGSQLPAGSADLFSRLMWLEDKLAKHGFHKMSPWWRETFRKWLNGGKRQIVLRVGRRGGKSSDLCRLAVVMALFGKWEIPTGDIGEFLFISVRKEEALKRLLTIKEILRVIGVDHVAKRFEIELPGRNVMFKVYPANFRVAVGMTTIGLVCDEVARWKDEETGANPAREVLKSVKPSLITQKNAKIILSSSPWSSLDLHYDEFEKGDTKRQDVFHANTWTANPTLTEAECREEEEDEETFLREYAAIPMRAGMAAFFDPAAIEAAVDLGLKLPRRPRDGEEVVAGADFAFRSDHSALVVCHKLGLHYVMAEVDIVRPKPGQPLKVSETCNRFATTLTAHRLSGVMADFHYREAVVEHLEPHQIAFMDAPKEPYRAYVRARVLFNQGLVRIPDDPGLIRQLKEVQAAPTKNGGISIKLPKRSGGGHSDEVSAFINCLWQRAGKQFLTNDLPRVINEWTAAEQEAADYEKQLKKEAGEEDEVGWILSEREWITDL